MTDDSPGDLLLADEGCQLQPLGTTRFLWSLFVRCPFNDYNLEELKVRRTMRLADLVWTPLSLLIYLCLTSAALWTLPTAAQTGALSWPPLAEKHAVLVVAVLSCYVLYMHMFTAPSPTQDASVDDFKGIGSPFGRWWFLTRQTIGLQAWHQALSYFAIAMQWPNLASRTHAVALWLCGPANFVTIHFFVLVWPHPDFKASSAKWEKKSVPFREVMFMLHVWQLPIACIDVLFLKDRAAMLRLTPPVLGLAFIFVSFVAYYLGIVAANFVLKGVYPYGVMRECGTSPKKWVKLIAVQIGVLVIFFVPMYAAAMFFPASW